MSDVHSILSAITDANRALEAEPGYKAHIAELVAASTRDGSIIATHELTIHTLRSTISDLEAKVRDLTEARDNAQFNFLELEERCGAVMAALGPFAAKVNGLLPPKPTSEPVQPEPVAVAEPEQPQPQPAPVGPYAGKLYTDFKEYISMSDWLAGGGTEFGYNWHDGMFEAPEGYNRPEMSEGLTYRNRWPNA